LTGVPLAIAACPAWIDPAPTFGTAETP